MEEKTHSQLKDEAAALGIGFKGNTSKVELISMIEEFYDSEAEDSKVAVRTDLAPEDELEEEVPELPNRIMKRIVNISGTKSKEKSLKAMIAKAKEAAFTKRIVTISSNDTRDNQHVTAIPLFFENQYFALDRIVPLNIAVELEQCLIDIAKTTTIAIHKRERVGGNTGKTVYAKKFNISYEDTRE